MYPSHPLETLPKTQWYHRRFPFFLRPGQRCRQGSQPGLEVVRLDVEPGVIPSGKPPVRIFLGTQSAHFRAERVFVWSIEKHRDPTRVYEIFLMNNLKGIDRSDWKTGFSYYRYAVPELAGGEGRAIYNDVNQVYLTDPAELFDQKMHGAGVVSFSPERNSVILIDCKIMKQYWSLKDVVAGCDHDHFTKPLTENNLWIELDKRWNVRDHDRLSEQQKCLTYELLHTQPWQPFCGQIKYSHSPSAVIWHRLEREADDANYMLFTKDVSSKRFLSLIEQYQLMHEDVSVKELFNGSRLQRNLRPVTKLVEKTKARSILDYGAGKGEYYQLADNHPKESRYRQHPEWPGVKVICYDPGYEPFKEPFLGKVDGVVSTDVVEHIPQEDIPWVLDEMFQHAARFVYVLAANYPAKAILPNGENAHCTTEPAEWWAAQMALTARRYPGVKWMLGCDTYSAITRKKKRTYHSGTG